ncbi:MAG TPA: WD40 repeat domain-containing protein [Gemmatimonadales bacterium]|nr:WD40 repeat domain-containing protein [Gemmatimonadales bacterium]
MGSRLTPLGALLLPGLLLAGPLTAQPRHDEAGSGVRSSAALVPAVLLSPDKSKLLLMERTAPSNGGEAGSTYSALIVQPIGRGEIRRMILPWKARVRSVIWAPDGNRVGFTILEETGTSLWVGDPYSGVIRMLAGPVLLGGGAEGCQWLHSGEKILCQRIPAGGSPGSTEGQLVVYSVSGSDRAIGRPARYGKVSISPDGKYLTVETGEGSLELWDASEGTVLRVLRDRNVVVQPGSDVVPAGPRSFEWRADKPSTLVWVEAQDGGNPAQPAPVRDRLFQLASPFTGAPLPFAALEFRSRGIVWSGDDLAVVSEGWSRPQRQRSWIVRPDRGGAPRLLGQAKGNFITRQKSGGGDVLLTSGEGRMAYLRGQGEPSGGPFLDRIDLTTGKVLRLWRSPAAFNEEVVAVLDAEGGRFITRRESATEPPNYYIRDLKKKDLTPLTRFK